MSKNDSNNDGDAGGEGGTKLDFMNVEWGDDDDGRLPDDLTGDDDEELDTGLLLGGGQYVDVDDVDHPDPVTKSHAVEEDLLDKPQYASLYHLPSREDACHCGAYDAPEVDLEPGEEPDVDCSCVEDEDSRPIRHDVADRSTVVDAVDELDPDGDNRRSIYVVVVDERPSPEEMDDRVELTVADTSGLTKLQTWGDSGLTVGDEAVITEVGRSSDSDYALGELTITSDTHIETVDVEPHHPDEVLIERSELNRAEDKFRDAESVTAARNWMADVIIDEKHIETPYGDDDMMMYVDDEEHEDYGLFVGNGEDRLKELIDEYLPPEHCNSQNKGQIVSLIQDRTRVPSGTHDPGEPDTEARRWSVAVDNGVIDLRTGELYPHDPAWRATSKLPVEYHPERHDGLGDEWDSFLSSITKDPEDKRTLLYLVAHAICRTYPVEAIFAGVGPGGNGKTTFTKALTALLGDDGIGEWKMSVLCGDYPFGGKPFVGNRLAIDDDATSVKVHDITSLKALTGGSSSQVNIKDEKLGGYDNYATTVYWSNDPPLIGDKSKGVKRRLYPIIMPNEFVPNPDPDDPQQKQKVSEERLLESLHSDEELEALLTVAVSLAGEMHGGVDEMHVGRDQDERWNIYQQYSDSILQFWSEMTTESRGTRVPVSVVYEVYVNWCEANGVDTVSNKGKNNFWSLSDQCPVVSYKSDVWIGDERAIEHIALTDDAMTYAPQWIQEKWGDSTESPDEDNPSLANRLDRVTPIGDLTSTGVQTVKGTVKSRKQYQTNYDSVIQLRIEDATHGIGVIEYTNDDDDGTEAVLDGVKEGDKVELERVILKNDKGEPMLYVDPGYSSVTVAERGDMKDVDDRHSTDADADVDVEDEQDGDGDDECKHDDAVYTIKQVIEAAKIRAGGLSAPKKEWVVPSAADRLGVDETTVEKHVEQMKINGKLYEPDEGRYRVVGDVDVDDDDELVESIDIDDGDTDGEEGVAD